MEDSRGPRGIFSRGANVYNGTSLSAHSGGGPQFGRPKKAKSTQPQSTGSSLLKTNQAGPVDMDPKPVNPLLGAIQRRLQGGQRDN